MGCSVQLEPIKVEQEKKGQEEVAGCCKICYEANDDSPLLHGVCDCKGSLDGVHGRCLVKWQLKRTSKPWNCEICDAKIQWPANETLALVELLSELSEKKAPHTGHAQRQPTTAAAAERQPRTQGPSTWRLLKQTMSAKCQVAARSFRTVGKSIFPSGTRQQRRITATATNSDLHPSIEEMTNDL